MMSFVFMPPNATRSMSGDVIQWSAGTVEETQSGYAPVATGGGDGACVCPVKLPVQNLPQDVMSVEILHKA
jgi:hypothetical protein